ncbi:MAG: NACHT domain-containing protein, partial [bacterium]|nr:NACHT domain-containing protein [bacterium]
MKSLFQTLGYEKIGTNVSKTGREIDIIAVNEAEERRVIAECKAQKKKTGGDDLNKFAGALEIEKSQKNGTIGYFISLSGFTGSALEQEEEMDGNRFICFDGKNVIDKLIKGHFIKPIEYATEQAGRYAVDLSNEHKIEKKYELLAHGTGWIWAIYYSLNKKRTHFALIHADGEALAEEKADSIITADETVGGILSSLTYLTPPDPPPDLAAQIEEAKTKYFKYLAADCGEITFEGIPSDTGLATERIPIEKIFVPLYLNPYMYEQSKQFAEREMEPEFEEVKRRPVGEVLSENPRLAILATPGGGKTTLLNRLAVAYAFPERRSKTDDVLPDRNWLPILIHCRDLKGIARSPIREIILSVHKRAEIDPELTDAFGLLINREFKGDNILLLIDGLDEITDEGDRVAFIKQLRTFLNIYPAVNIVVTSREAGFRSLGGALANECTHYKIADFDDNDIKRLVKLWSIEVEGDTPQNREDAENLFRKIIDNKRIKELAVNPLLLTTLLAVKRWVRDLPTRRADLYRDAVEMLLRTWNVEGFKPINIDEAIP